MSKAFAIRSDLPQGNLQSAKLYNIIMDHILNDLEESGLGCNVNLTVLGSSAYADNLICFLDKFAKIFECMF